METDAALDKLSKQMERMWLRFDRMTENTEASTKQISNDVKEVSTQVAEITLLLRGGGVIGDMGLVSRVRQLESKQNDTNMNLKEILHQVEKMRNDVIPELMNLRGTTKQQEQIIKDLTSKVTNLKGQVAAATDHRAAIVTFLSVAYVIIIAIVGAVVMVAY